MRGNGRCTHHHRREFRLERTNVPLPIREPELRSPQRVLTVDPTRESVAHERGVAAIDDRPRLGSFTGESTHDEAGTVLVEQVDGLIDTSDHHDRHLGVSSHSHSIADSETSPTTTSTSSGTVVIWFRADSPSKWTLARTSRRRAASTTPSRASRSVRTTSPTSTITLTVLHTFRSSDADTQSRTRPSGAFPHTIIHAPPVPCRLTGTPDCRATAPNCATAGPLPGPRPTRHENR